MITDLSSLCVGPGSSIREAMACIDENDAHIALVVDAERRLLDTITDGDVRRAILAGIDLDSPVSALVGRRSTSPYPAPVTAPADSPPAMLLRFMRERRVRQLPLLDRFEHVGGDTVVEVPVTDLSSFLQGKRPVDLFRMDIEGYEVEAICGLERAIKDGSFCGKILFECHFPRYDDKTHSMREPLRMLLSQGYYARYLTSTDESKPRIRDKGYRPAALVQTSDTRFRGIYERVADEDLLSLVCDTGGVRDVMLERTRVA